jgi:hypothetical protein
MTITYNKFKIELKTKKGPHANYHQQTTRFRQILGLSYISRKKYFVFMLNLDSFSPFKLQVAEMRVKKYLKQKATILSFNL